MLSFINVQNHKDLVWKILLSGFLMMCVTSLYACPVGTQGKEHNHLEDHPQDGGQHDIHQHTEQKQEGHHATEEHPKDAQHPKDTQHHEGTGDHGMGKAEGHVFLFVNDTKNNKWLIQVFHPTHGLVKTVEVPELAERTAKKAKETNSDDVGPGWGDALPSHDHKRIIVNATNADALIVVDVKKMEVEKIFEFGFGNRPVHNYLPNHGTEAWARLDGKGEFFVLDTQTLQPIRGLDKLVPCTTLGKGHGKLVYSKELGDRYFCTNTSEPAGFALDGKEKKILKRLEVCGVKPEDDPKTPEDESKGPLKGGTHDKGYLPGPNLVFFQCLGGAGFSFVNPETLEVVKDKVPMAGGIAHSPGNEYVLSLNPGGKEKQVQVWDKMDAQKNGYEFDYTFDVDGEVSARGTHFRKEGEHWQAWVPQTKGTKVAVINLATRKVALVEVGRLTAPPGESHFSRRGAVSAGAFYTYTDEGLFKIDGGTLKVSKMTGALQGSVSRLAFVNPEGHK